MTFVVGLGANLGSRLAALRAAVALLDADTQTTVEARSSVYETPPLGPPQPDHLNAAVRLRTTRTPHELLALCQSIEAQLGRVRTVHWGPRVIDLDLLTGPNSLSDSPRLELPHPHLHERAFALIPWAEVAGTPALPVRFPELVAAPWPLIGEPGPWGAGTAPNPIDALAIALASVGDGEGSGRVQVTRVEGPHAAVRQTMKVRAEGTTFRGVTLTEGDAGALTLRLIGVAEGSPAAIDLLPMVSRPARDHGWFVRLGQAS